MGMVPFWHVFDSYELPDTDTRSLTDPQQAWALIERLYGQPPAPHVRIRRLVSLLARELPDDPPGTSPEVHVWEDGLAPVPETVEHAACSLGIGAGGFERVLPRALTLARELLLDVVDDMHGVYVPIRGLPVPQAEGVQYLRALLHPQARRPWADTAALRQALKTGLTELLQPMGFGVVAEEGAVLRFERHWAQGLLSITAHISGPEKSLQCSLHLEDRRPADGRSDVARLNTTLEALRQQHEPAWSAERTGRPFIRLAMTSFWVDWMLEDLAKWGLPLLEPVDRSGGDPSDLPQREETNPKPAATTPWSLVPTEEEAEAAASLEVLRARAQSGDAQAMLELAYAYAQGQHTEADLGAAAALFRKAADQGLDAAMYNLGVCYWRGDGVAEDKAQAIDWFFRAADRGHGHALYMLGMAYRNGIGVPKDVAASNALMVVAGAKGVAQATAEGVIAGAGSWSDLAKELIEHRVSSALKARHLRTTPKEPERPVPATQGTPAPAEREKSPVAAAQRAAAAGTSRSAASARRGPADERPTRDVPALWAAAYGALGWLVVLLLGGAPPSGGALAVHGLGVVAGAFGVYRLSGTLGHGGAVRWVLTLLALLPGIGALTCAVQLVRSLRSN